MTVQRMAALGSSFAAGPGIAPVADRPSMRSARNYAHLAAEALGATLVDATVSGATTDTILRTPQRLGLRRVPPQIDSIDPAADFDLVTITAGGNDLGYLGSILSAAIASRLARGPLTRPLARRIRSGAKPEVTAEQVDLAARGLIGIVEEVARRAPHARILLVDYLTIIGEQTRPSRLAPFTQAELARFRRTSARVGEAFAAAEEGSVAELVRISTLSSEHAVDAAEPWVNGLRLSARLSELPSSFHPNAAGMKAAADAVVAQIGS